MNSTLKPIVSTSQRLSPKHPLAGLTAKASATPVAWRKKPTATSQSKGQRICIPRVFGEGSVTLGWLVKIRSIRD